MASNIVEFLKHKNILITGSTGFLSKIFIEKILRVQPCVGKLFLLIRAADLTSAKDRLQKEIIDKELFKVLREQHGQHFDGFMETKLIPVVGDTSLHDLGITDQSLKKHLWENLHVIANTAANTNFDERYDISLGVNTMGVGNLIKFAKGCINLQVFVHVSTAFVCGEKNGVIIEKPLQMGETLVEEFSGEEILDVEMELKLVKKTLESIEKNSSVMKPNQVTKQMKELGLERASKFGWPNTYTFTKSMGEMLLGALRGDLPVVIIRPSIIESTYAEPFPGWMEGNRTMDSIVIAYGKGRLTSFMANPDLILDVIPADMVANAMIAAMAKHALDYSNLSIYHVASSTANPFSYSVVVEKSYEYFSKYPCFGKDGNLVRVQKIYMMESMESFVRYMRLRYKIPLQVMSIANELMCQIFEQRYSQLLRKYNFAMYLAELYRPYVFFKGSFDNLNTERLQMELSEYDGELFNFDCRRISWPHYLLDIHLPGVMKYVAV